MATHALVTAFLALFLLATPCRSAYVGHKKVSIPVSARGKEPASGCGYSGPSTGTVPLYAGQSIAAGTLTYTLTDAGADGFTGDVSIAITNPSCTIDLSEDAHVDIVSSLKTKGSELAPGRWPCKKAPTAGDTLQTSCTVSDDLSCCGSKFLYVHVVLTCGGSSETAFGGEDACSTKRWCRVTEIAPPCGDCSCDTSEDRCFQTTSCGAFPDTCSFSPVCENELATCVAPTSCGSDTCDSDVYCPDISSTVADANSAFNMCRAKTPCTDARCVAAGTEVCDQSECAPPTDCLAGTTCDGAFSCPSLEDAVATTLGVPKACRAEEACTDTRCVASDTTVCDQADCKPPTECEEDEQCSGTFSCPGLSSTAAEDLGVQDSCVAPSRCTNLTDCDIFACPADCPPTCPACDCPPCFRCGTGDEAKCVPETDGNGDPVDDASCNPCGKTGNSICRAETGDQSFKCCPPTSNCKNTIIPGRLGVAQDALAVSFVCSANCGGGCDTADNNLKSNACVLFSPLSLTTDGNPDTDDILNVCPDTKLNN